MQELARKCGLDLKAPSLSNEGVYVDLAGGSLEDVLKKLLRGYNYFLIKADGSGKGSLTVLGKVQRVEMSYPPPPAVSVAPPAAPLSNPSTGETAALPAEQELMPGGGSSRPHGAGQRSGEVSASALLGAAEEGGSRASAQSASPSGGQTASSSPTQTALSSLAPPAPPQIAGHEPPPQIPANLVGGTTASQGGSGSAGGGSAASAAGSGSTSGGSTGNGSFSSGGNTPPAPPAPPQIPGF
jgi:hypothetical protein